MLGQGDAATLALTRHPYVLWALAFLGGFSDRFATLVFDNIVRTVGRSSNRLVNENQPESSEDEAEDSRQRS